MRDQYSPARGERNKLHGPVEIERPSHGLASGDVPDPRCVIGRARDQHPAIRAECRTEHGVLVLQDRPDPTASGDLEEPDLGVLVGEDGEILLVRTELDPTDDAGKLRRLQHPLLRAGVHGPPCESFPPTARDQTPAAGDEYWRGKEERTKGGARFLTMGNRCQSGFPMSSGTAKTRA